ncbi:MAG: hypothetical protein HZB50_10765 [Chloroflexi bacterium]|nr:hypothetical protein [Chloroflexota bacterium]
MLGKFRSHPKNIDIKSKMIFMVALTIILVGCSQGSNLSIPTLTPSFTAITNKTQQPEATPSLLENLPLGSYIGFVRGESVNYVEIQSIFLMSIDGKEQGMLIEDIAKNATISPDGSIIAYSNFIDFGIYELTLVDLRTYKAEKFRIPNCYLSDNTSGWSPDGKKLAVSCWDHIAVVHIDGDTPIIDKTFSLPENGVISELSWSPDGKFLSFYVSNPQDARDSSAHGPYLIETQCLDATSQCQIIPSMLGVEETSIAKWTFDNILAVAQKNRISFIDPITRNQISSVVMPSDTPILSFVISADNEWIIYSSVSENSLNALYIIPKSGGEPKLISEAGGDILFWLQVSK